MPLSHDPIQPQAGPQNLDAVDDGRVQPSEVERTAKVLNDLAKRLSVIAATELTRSRNGQVAATPGDVDPAHLAVLIEHLKTVRDAAEETESSQESNTGVTVPSTASIVEISDTADDDGKAQDTSPTPLVDVG